MQLHEYGSVPGSSVYAGGGEAPPFVKATPPDPPTSSTSVLAGLSREAAFEGIPCVASGTKGVNPPAGDDW